MVAKARQSRPTNGSFRLKRGSACLKDPPLSATCRSTKCSSVAEKLISSGAVPATSSLAALLKRDTQKWGKLIKAQKIAPEG